MHLDLLNYAHVILCTVTYWIMHIHLLNLMLFLLLMVNLIENWLHICISKTGKILGRFSIAGGGYWGWVILSKIPVDALIIANLGTHVSHLNLCKDIFQFEQLLMFNGYNIWFLLCIDMVQWICKCRVFLI